MDVDDRVVLTTPEGVTVDLVLAGLGSRCAAALIDGAVRVVVIIAVAIVAGLAGGPRGGWAAAAGVIGAFLVLFGYDVLFEVTAGGRTPGKRWCGIRVVDRSGGPVRLVASVVRNLLRLVDFLPSAYLIGTVTLLISPRNQRLGDLAAGTYVIRERRAAAPAAWVPPPVEQIVRTFDVAQVTAEEVATARRFLERRAELLPAARTRLARDLAGRLRTKVAGFESVTDDEQFLEQLVAVRSRAIG